MPVDKVELAKDLETPEYQTLVKETLSKKDFTIRTKDEETTFQTNFKNDVIEKEIPKKISEVHTQYDKDVEEVTGLKRGQNEKSYDFVKRVLGELKKETAPALKQEIADLKKQIAEGDKSGATAQALREAEEKYKTSLKEKDDLIAKLQGETSTQKLQSLLATDYAGIKSKFVKTLPPMFDKTEKAILTEALSLGVVGEDGKLYVSDGKGGVKKDKSFNPIPMSAHLEAEFAGVIEKAAPPKGGTGSQGGKGGETNPEEITADTFVMPDNVKTGDDLMTYMLEQGIKRGTDQFTAIWNKFRPTLADGKSFKAPAPPAKK